MADPDGAVKAKRQQYDAVHPKMYITDPAEIAAVSKRSGLLNLEPLGYNYACVEPHNLTINTRTFCASLRRHLEQQGVEFHMGTTVTEIRTRSALLLVGEPPCRDDHSWWGGAPGKRRAASTS